MLRNGRSNLSACFGGATTTTTAPGLAGDLYVHLLTGLHVVTGSLGPTRVYSCGGTRFWKDGRDAPDVMLGVLDYPKTDAHPEFTLSLRVNLACGSISESFGLRFIGSEGQMTVGFTGLTLSKVPRETEPGYTIDTFSKPVRESFLSKYKQEFPDRSPNADSIRGQTEMKFTTPAGYSAHQEHHRNFYKAVRSRKPFFEDSIFGLRTGWPISYDQHKYHRRPRLQVGPGQNGGELAR